MSAAGVASVEAAPAGGWTVSHVVAGADGGVAWVIVKQFDPPLFFAEGVVFWLDAGALDLVLISP